MDMGTRAFTCLVQALEQKWFIPADQTNLLTVDALPPSDVLGKPPGAFWISQWRGQRCIVKTGYYSTVYFSEKAVVVAVITSEDLERFTDMYGKSYMGYAGIDWDRVKADHPSTCGIFLSDKINRSNPKYQWVFPWETGSLALWDVCAVRCIDKPRYFKAKVDPLDEPFIGLLHNRHFPTLSKEPQLKKKSLLSAEDQFLLLDDDDPERNRYDVQRKIYELKGTQTASEYVHGAIAAGDVETLRCLLDHKAVDPNLKLCNGLTLFMYVCAGAHYGENRSQMAKLFLSAGANREAKNSEQKTAFDLAAERGVDLRLSDRGV